MAHTPGPWLVSITEYEGRTKRYEVMQAGWSRVICNVHKSGKANGYKYAVPAEDNARLIASAPDMLEMLKMLKKALGPDGDYAIARADGKPMGLGESVMVGEIFMKADAVIAKAEGEG
jgi:hypothetical protein